MAVEMDQTQHHGVSVMQILLKTQNNTKIREMHKKLVKQKSRRNAKKNGY